MKNIVVVKVGVGNSPSEKAKTYTKSVKKQFKKAFKNSKIVAVSVPDTLGVEVQTFVEQSFT